MTIIVGSVAGGNWTTTGAWVGGVVPTAADDVQLTATTGNITINTAAPVCRSLDCTGYTGTLAGGGSATLTVGDASGGSLKFVAGMTTNLTSSNLTAINFVSTTTGNQITSGGKAMPAMTFNGVGGAWQFQDNQIPATTGNVITVTNGSVDFNGKTYGSSSLGWNFASNNANVRSITFGAMTFWLNSSMNMTNITNLTLSAGSETWECVTSGQVTFNAGSASLGNILFPNALTASFNGTPNNFASFNVNLVATNAQQFIALGGDLNTGAFTISSGSSAAVRGLIRSNTMATPRTITASTATVSYYDFRDIIGAGAANWNLSATTGLSGDCGGNSGITFTTPINCYWVNNTGSWSTASKWRTASGGGVTARVPLPQDTCIFDSSSFTTGSQTATVDVGRTGSVDFTGVTNTPAWAKTTTSGFELYGSITMVSGMTNSGGVTITLRGRGSNTFTTGGLTFTNPIDMNVPGGTMTQTANTTFTTSITCTMGTWECNGFNLTAPTLAGNGGTINLGNVMTATSGFNGSGATNIIYGPNCVVTCGATSFSNGSVTLKGLVITNAYNQFTSATTSVTIGSSGVTCGSGSQVSAGSLTVNGVFNSGANTVSFGNAGTTIFLDTYTSTAALTISAADISFGTGGATCTTCAISGGSITVGAGQLTCSSTWTQTGGTFTDNGGGVSATTFTSTTGTRAVVMNGTWTATSTGTVWSFATSGMTLTRNSSTIVISNVSASAKTFAGGALTYGTLSLPGGSGSGIVTVTGANRFTRILAAPDTSFNLQSGVTTTLDNPPMWVGTSGHNIIVSASAAGAATIATTGTPACDYLTLSKSTITGPAASYAGANSTNGGTNTGWTFSNAPNIFNDTVTETIVSSDALAVAATFTFTQTESVAGSDTLAAAVNFTTAMTESITGADTIAVVMTVNAPLSFSVTGSDSIDATAVLNAALTFSAVADDSEGVAAIYAVALTETINGTDSESGGLVFGATVDEEVTADDSVVASRAFLYEITETIIASDSVDVGSTYNVSFTETVAAYDLIQTIGPKTIPDYILTGYISDKVTLTGSY